MKRNIGLATAILAMCLQAPGAAQAQYLTKGLGTLTCPEFLDHYAKEGSSADLQFFKWAQGYMSGANAQSRAALGISRDLLPGRSQDEIQFLHNYCVQNLGHKYGEGVRTLYMSLPILPGPGKPR